MAAVEFALTFPVVALILLGSLEFGWYFTRLAMVNSVAFDAARYGATFDNTIQSQVRAQAAARDLLDDVGLACDTAACTIQATRYVSSGVSMISIDLRVPYDQLTGIVPSGGVGLAGMLFDPPDTLRARGVAAVTAW